MVDPIGAVEAALDHRFSDRALLELALTHPSYEAEAPEGTGSNGRLEFLGDSVLGLVVSSELYDAWDMSEGEMTKVRASLVDERTLAVIGTSIELPDALRLGRGEESSGGRSKPALIADAMEAVIAAVYLDAGLEAARRIVLRLWGPFIERAVTSPGERDHKSLLQEILARRSVQPEYEVEGSGPDHERHFEARVSVEGEVIGRGSGTSKKRAQQAAARDALRHLDAGDA